ncbi:MAG TPA: hypothetical protein GX707_08060 [Epulopiscium sp.]|nr:hypothetical protein [Candidatus Epulonipiscium sp.]
MTKKELKQIYYINKEILMWKKELEKLECRSLIKSPTLSLAPGGGGKTFEDASVKKIEIELIINGKLAEIQIQRKKILEYIEDIDDSLLRQIMFFRNVSCMSWGEVAMELEKTESCVKMMYQRHFDSKEEKWIK